jgi:phosphatidate cytidylyltransferase
LEFIKIINKIFKNNLKSIIINSFFLIYVSLFCFLFLYFSNFLQLKIILFTLLIGCVFSDIGGFIFGKIFKGPKLTKISPNKTYSGMIGGYVLSIIILSSLYNSSYLINQFVNLNINFFIFILFISTTSQIGDIIISYFKRLSKIKDTGKIIPGHGGLLDRIDGMIFAFPFSYLILKFNII